MSGTFATHTIIRLPDPEPEWTKVSGLEGASFEFYFPHSKKRRAKLIEQVTSCGHLHSFVVTRKSVFVSMILYRELLPLYIGSPGVVHTAHEQLMSLTRGN